MSDGEEVTFDAPPREDDVPAVADDDDAAGDVVADVDALAAALDGSDADSDDSDDDDAGAEGGAAPDDAAGAVDDAEGGAIDLSAITDKKEAKRTLSKKQYKKWKKKFGKKSKKDKKSGKKDKKGAAKKKQKKAAEAAGAKKKRAKKYTPVDGDDDASSAPPASDEDDDEGAGGGKRKRAARARRVVEDDMNGDYEMAGGATGMLMQRGAGTSNKMTAKKLQQFLQTYCEDFVAKLREAREADSNALQTGQPPVHRLALVKTVRAVANRIDLHEMLVEAGFLQEICAWMCSGRQLAPLDLRSAALDALVLMKFEHVEGGYLPQQKSSKSGDEIIGYEGVTKETLMTTNLGFAANLLRMHPEETTQNQAKASKLLQRLSRAFAGEMPEEDQSQVKRWQSQGDQSVLPPFEPLKTASEKFVERTTKVDPLDPTSYLRVPPMRLQPAYITGVFHTGSGEE